MKRPGIRGQLTAWYSLILALSLAAFGTVAYFAMLYSVHDTLQSELRERTGAVQSVLATHAPRGPQALRRELAEFAASLGPGDRIRVADASGGLLFASPGMELPVQPRRRPLEPHPWRIWLNGSSFLALRRNLDVAGSSYVVTVAVATGSLDRALTLGTILIFASAPLFLGLAALGGYWMSSRALAPVDRMTRAARNIGVHDLALRLEVPPARDELARLAGTLNDMLARLESAFLKITRFTADASHELRTPVAVIRTGAEIALRKSRTETEYRETLSLIVRETDNLSQLIESLLTVARADSGTVQMHMARTDLGAVLDGACDKSRILAQEKGLTLSRHGSPSPLWVQADPDAVERLLLSLLDNAVKYTPGGGRIDVKLAADDGFAVAEIRDTGIGISPGDLPHIFDRFYRADRARSREPGGAGLGLAIGLWIAQAHGGEIRVQSELSRGSSFQLRLPLSPA